MAGRDPLCRFAVPSYCVYQLAENFPRVLHYGDVVCKLEFVRGEMDGEWVFRARKIVPSTSCRITSSRFGARALQAELRRGFLIQDGTPSAKVLDRLVKDGFATKR